MGRQFYRKFSDNQPSEGRMESHRVKIDGVETVLTYDSFSGARGHQYLTPGAKASHAFPEKLKAGDKFRTNGHDYEVMS